MKLSSLLRWRLSIVHRYLIAYSFVLEDGRSFGFGSVEVELDHAIRNRAQLLEAMIDGVAKVGTLHKVNLSPISWQKF